MWVESVGVWPVGAVVRRYIDFLICFFVLVIIILE